MNTSDYTYSLPADKIALYPLAQRDASRLLVYNKGEIQHTTFRSLSDYLPENAFLIFNNTKVIPARLHFQKESGAVIEIFLLNPLQPSILLSETMAAQQRCRWHCTIGNLKKWPSDLHLKKTSGDITLTARLVDRIAGEVDFAWDTVASFAEVIQAFGETPLPPYIKRKAEAADSQRYQTIYSRSDGAVAAPTAGLHFTAEVFSQLAARNIGHDFVTLHVSAGTFQPIKTQRPEEHIMHEEQVVITLDNVRNLMADDRFLIAVGTTSMRTLESLFWFGAKLLQDANSEFRIDQQDPYLFKDCPDARRALNAVVDYMERNRLTHLVGETSIYIRPGYSFKICRGLVTNFHQPASTLILLVAAFIGEDWRSVYEEALRNEYRFLSYGDSSLLMPKS